MSTPEIHSRGSMAGRPSGIRRWLALAVFIGVPLAMAYASSLAMDRATMQAWYPSLAKPWWTPPSWVFPPVWTALYIMMGTAAWLVWSRRDQPGARLALGLFAVQLVLNGLWTPLFFGLQSPVLSLIDIAALWVAILGTTLAFARVSRAAALLMLPYLAWVTFGSALNVAIWQLNR